MNKTGETESTTVTGGAVADALTFVRLALTPIIMFVIIKGWPGLDMAVLASVLFVIAAATDVFDDYFGGTENAPHRKFGWFDDIADIVLVVGTLAAMLYVTHKSGVLAWTFAVPAGVIILREIIVGLAKGYEMTKSGWPETKFGSIKNGLVMLATCTLLATPWITNWVEAFMASRKGAMEVYNSASPHIWMIGEGILWFAALVSLVTGFMLLTTKAGAANDG